ncbi:hypothetical protein C0J52_06612, partial [Blattella germanica]
FRGLALGVKVIVGVCVVVLTTEYKVFILEHYLLSYGVGRQNGPTLRHVENNSGSNLTRLRPLLSRSSAVRDYYCVNGREELDVQEPSTQTRIMNTTRNIGPYFVEDDAQNPLTVNQERYREIIIDPLCRICAAFVTATTVHAARWSYSQHGKGVTCPSATNFWRSLNFPWNGTPVP